MPKSTVLITAKALLFSSIQFSFATLEMADKTSVRKYSTQKDLDVAIKSLKNYLLIGGLWTIGTSMIFYFSCGVYGLMINILFNFFFILWIAISYENIFKQVAREHNLVLKTN